jgi:hypothetical protein
MERRHVIVLVPARIGTGLCTDGITAPAVINFMLTQVVPAVGHAPFPKGGFSKVCHVAGVSGPVSAAVDEKEIEWFAFIRELLTIFLWYEFVGRAMAHGAAFRWLFPGKDKATDCTSPWDLLVRIFLWRVFRFYVGHRFCLPGIEGIIVPLPEIEIGSSDSVEAGMNGSPAQMMKISKN